MSDDRPKSADEKLVDDIVMLLKQYALGSLATASPEQPIVLAVARGLQAAHVFAEQNGMPRAALLDLQFQLIHEREIMKIAAQQQKTRPRIIT